MRFAPEANHGANAGLKTARDFLEPVKGMSTNRLFSFLFSYADSTAAKFPWITYADLWTLAGVCGVQELGGPSVPWRPGREDLDVSACTPDGRLPDGDKGKEHVHQIFGRLGFNDQETVALIGAHSLGRCHPDRSGFDGPWDFSPTVFTNEFFRLLLSEKWTPKKWDGPFQWTDNSTKSLMMLPTDMALKKDGGFEKYVELYAKDQDLFFKDFAKVFSKLLELGVPFKNSPEDRFVFKRSEE